jgi:hypothetical protein
MVTTDVSASKGAATPPVRRRSWTVLSPPWSKLLWGLALLGVILLPSNYRAGAEFPHSHSLVQLWVDAADGTVHHHAGSPAWDDVESSSHERESQLGLSKEHPDAGEHEDSTPTTSGIHLLLSAITILAAVTAGPTPAFGPAQRLTGQILRVLLPPPR